MPDLFPSFSAGDILPAADWNSAFDLAESSLGALGPFVVSGLVPSAGTGLSVDVTAGTALIGGLVTKSATFAISGLTDATTNHLFLNQDGTGVANTTGTQPADSVKLGTATTSGGAVTAVDTSALAGRQTRFGTLVPRTLTRVTITPASDADVTLTNAQADNLWITLATGSWTAGHNLILPATAGLHWWITNTTAFSAVPKTAAGTGPTLTTLKTAMVAADGTNIVRMTTDA